MTELIDGISMPTRAAITGQRERLAPYLRITPVLDFADIEGLEGITAQFKFELLQVSGTFKARGAFANILSLSPEHRETGVTAVSAGNHAVAVACAAHHLGVSAKVVMIRTASHARVALCKRYGAEVVMADDGASAFATMREIEARENRFFVHPFNGLATVLGTATLGAEWAEQSGGLDAVIIPIGGGGLAAGVATAFRLWQPDIEIFGVEPEGADVMARSFAAGAPQKMGPQASIADSLMAPHTEAYSLELCRRHIDALVRVSDDELRAAMHLLFDALKLAPEPACAAAAAALSGPLRNRLAGRRVGVLLCGTNTDPATLTRHLS
jgi:threonine dehydratase